ncbi:MAG: hypothetical protein AABX07_03875 [Nanoarchaeota archaeon]
MGWKAWSYWLKGGIICLVIFVIIFTITLNLSAFIQDGFNLTLFLPAYITLVALYGYSGPDPSLSIQYLLVVIEGFIIGIILGGIYGKIKSRNQSSSE